MSLIKFSVAIVSFLVIGADSNESHEQFNNFVKNNENALLQLTSPNHNSELSIPHPVNKRRLQYDSGSGFGGSRGGGHLSSDAWSGRWFPEKVQTEGGAQGGRGRPSVSRGHLDQMTSMVDPSCDDGKTNLTLDWSGSLENFTCFSDIFPPDFETPAFIMRDYIPTAYSARHECMDKPIYYNTYLPTFGTHRPAWPKYGEYKFVPRQRWLHNLEHGAIVMLYHPCAHPLLVRQLKHVVKSCLFRHIITPYTLLSPKRPLAVVAWGWAMTMSVVDSAMVERFIMEHALKGPERLSQDGQYDLMLEHPAAIVTSYDDVTICPHRHASITM